MPDIQDNLNMAERLLNEKYEMNILYIDDEDGKLKPMQSINITADAMVEKAANGLAKLRLTNIKIDGESRFKKLIENDGPARPGITIRVDL